MKKKNFWTLIILLSLLGSLTMVIPTLTNPNEPEQDTKITIGMFTPDSAGLSFYGTWVKQGFALGLDYATGGTNKTVDGRTYEIKYYDTKGDPTTVAALATGAIENDGVDILVGGTYSSVAAAIMPVAETYKKLYFICPAADASLTGSLFNKYSFRVARNSWHDAETFAYYATEYLNATKIAFLAADYSFGYTGVSTMSAAIAKRGGTVVGIEYAPLITSDFTPNINRLLNVDTSVGIDVLMIIWAGSFNQMYSNLATLEVFDKMTVSGAVIDIYSMNTVEAGLKLVGATLEGQAGLCLYGYDLPDNPVNEWMVTQHKTRNIRPNAVIYGLPTGLNYRVPELFTASAFGTAQFLYNVTNDVTDLNIDSMITYLEGLNVTTPKGPTYMRPEDHQGLAEMYIAEAWNDTRTDSETYKQIIAKLVERLPATEVAPPIETTYTPTKKTTEPERSPGFEFLTGLFAVIAIIALLRKKKR